MRAIQRFKGLISKSRVTTPRTSQAPELLAKGFKAETRTSSSPPTKLPKTSKPVRQKSVAEEAAELIEQRKAYLRLGAPLRATGSEQQAEGEAQALNTSEKNTLFLGIGTGGDDEFFTTAPLGDMVAESPTGIDFDIYDRAYETEIKRIRSNGRKNRSWTYMTKLVGEKERDKYAGDDCMIIEAGRSLAASVSAHSSSTTLRALSLVHEAGVSDSNDAKQGDDAGFQREGEDGVQKVLGAAKETGSKFADLVAAMTKDMKAKSSTREQND